MAVLVPPHWPPPLDNQTTPRTPTMSRQSTQDKAGQVQQPMPTQSPQPYPYPIQQQQQQGNWTPSITAAPFYPSFYQPQAQSPQASPSQNPYYDPAANAQFAQWAYQQMRFNAQQQMPHVPAQQRSSPMGGGPPSGNEYFAGQHQVFAPFPSGTPPPPHPNAMVHMGAGSPQAGPRMAGHPQDPQYPGFHPYRRPNRSASQASQQAEGDWRNAPPGSFQPPYGRSDAAGSSSSVNSVGRDGSRQRTNSNQSSAGSGTSTHSASARNRNPPPITTAINGSHGRASNNTSHTSSPTSSVPSRPHNRQSSSSSSITSASSPQTPSASPRASTATTSSSGSGNPVARPARPSPLSQGNFTAAEKRMSRDDSDLAAMMAEAGPGGAGRSGGFKGRFKRALSLNASHALHEEDESGPMKIPPRRPGTPAAPPIAPANSSNGAPLSAQSGDDDNVSTATKTKKKSRAASLFNMRMNASTDNISLSSTVSSASVMIRKLGSMGKLARRNSLAGITSLFKDKKDKGGDDDEGGGSSKKDKKDKKKKSAKGQAAEASISHATVEIDRNSSDWANADFTGLSPAAKLARQHTLKSNAEDAAKAKAQAQAQLHETQTASASAVPTPWEKNTTTRAENGPTKASGVSRVSEDGTRVLVEEEDQGSDGESGDAGHMQSFTSEAWEDDEDWGGRTDDEDVTIRLGGTSINEEEEWVTDVPRPIEQRTPAKGILKNAGSYDQQDYLQDQAALTRYRSNSYSGDLASAPEPGPLARMPSPDPDHIDGLHRHGSHSSHNHSSGNTVPTLPALSFENTSETPKDSHSSEGHVPERSLFSHSNSSAPALSTMTSPPPANIMHRSATTPLKRLAFANNLSVYDTFPASLYDRRSEPATWSRLTPALAQRIKEELNSYKMEEMEVHAASRIHTQFFV